MSPAMETHSPASPTWKLELVDDSRPPVEEPLPVVTPGLTLVHDAAPTLDLAPLAPLGTPAHGAGWVQANPGLALADAAAPPPPAPQPPVPGPAAGETIIQAAAQPPVPGPAAGESILPAPAHVPARVAPGAAVPGGDRYYAEATREFVKGHIDAALWTHALARAGGDEAAARAGYLKARATALKLDRRERRADSMERRVQAARALADIDARDGDGGRSSAAAPGLAKPARRRLLLLAGGLGAVVVAGIAVFAFMKSGDNAGMPGGASAAAATSSSARRPATPAAQASAKAATSAASAEASAQALDEEFAARVQGLRDVGNWNVVVLQASEWTRRRPTNASAWGHLSAGYARLRQLDDAYESAKKAVELGPQDPHLWRNLGQVNQALSLPDAAIDAYQRAIALNDRDIESLAQVGVLNAGLGRLPEARVAFDRVLALSPEDTEALCGQATIAQKQGRGKDAEAILQKLKASDRSCVDRSATAPPPPTASAVPVKAATPGRR
jgi:Flp pilus assembly protein TadD